MRLIDADDFDRALANNEFTAALNEAASNDRAFEAIPMLYSTQSFRDVMKNRPTIDAIPIELTAQHLGRSFHSEPEKWADWLRMIRDDIPEEQDAQEAVC